MPGRHKILKVVAAGLVALYLLNNPTGAANTVNRMGGKLQQAGNSIGTFTDHLGK